MARRIAIVAALVALALPVVGWSAPPDLAYAWLQGPATRSLHDLPPPPGFGRAPLASNSFGEWLRRLPLKPDGAEIMLFNGQRRSSQGGAAAIVDIDIGNRDLQQCADAVIRLRAEYLYAAGKMAALAFNFTSGDRTDFISWTKGKTPIVRDQRLAWLTEPPRDSNHAGLRRWLDMVFMYAGTLSLQRELKPVADVSTVQPGDVLIQGGSPGHAVIVLDVARDAAGQPAMLLAQSFMPAQSIHVLRNPQGGVWFFPKTGQPIVTPDWRFMPGDLRRFAD